MEQKINANLEYNMLVQKINADINNSIVLVLGSKFNSKFFGMYDGCRLEVNYLDDERKPIFGHQFYVTYEKHLHYDSETGKWSNEYAFEMNYGTLGSFDLTDDINRIEYIKGMGKFVCDRELQTKIINSFNEYLERKSVISNNC